MQDFFKTSKLKICARTNITIPYRTRGKLKKYRRRAFSYQSSTLKMSYHELRAILIIMKAVVFQSSKQKNFFFVDWWIFLFFCGFVEFNIRHHLQHFHWQFPHHTQFQKFHPILHHRMGVQLWVRNFWLL